MAISFSVYDSLKQYQDSVQLFNRYKDLEVPKQFQIALLALGLNEEFIEFCSWLPATDDKGRIIQTSAREKVIEECGDILWYISALSSALDVSLSDFFQGCYEHYEITYSEYKEPEASRFSFLSNSSRKEPDKSVTPLYLIEDFDALAEIAHFQGRVKKFARVPDGDTKILTESFLENVGYVLLFILDYFDNVSYPEGVESVVLEVIETNIRKLSQRQEEGTLVAEKR